MSFGGDHASDAAHAINLQIPVDAEPTEVLANRFVAWRKIIKALNHYFGEVASVQAELVKQNVKLGHAVSFPFANSNNEDKNASGGFRYGNINDLIEPEMFLNAGNSSIVDLPGDLLNFHRIQAAAAQRTQKELQQNVIPRLEDLRRDLVVKIKEIKNLRTDFKNAVSKEQASSAKELNHYLNSIDLVTTSPSLLTSKQDPYLTRLFLEKQLGKQVNEENYLLEAFLNLQSSGKELEKVVVQEIQQALAVFGKLMGIQGKNLIESLCDKILNGFVSKESTFEWDLFIDRYDDNFVNPNLQLRKVSEVGYPYQDSLLSRDIRSGYLERRSKYLKSYSRAWYVLTPSFLHEFKSPDRKKDPFPVMSLSLDECQLTEDKTSSSSSSHKFILSTKHVPGSVGGSSSGSSVNTSNTTATAATSRGGHNWVFRAESKEKLKEWYFDLSRLTQMKSPVDRVNSFTQEQTHEAHLHTPGLVIPQDVSALDVPGKVRASEEFDREPSMISSPVLSDTSGVASSGEPFEEEIDLSRQQDVLVHDGEDDEEEVRRASRGRFPSEVNLHTNPVDVSKAADQDTLHLEAATFITPSEIKKLNDDDQASVFSYDLEHETNSTFPGDRDFRPVDSELPVNVERRLTMTSHKEEEPIGGVGVARASAEDEPLEEAIVRRRSSVSSAASMSSRRRPSRRATGSYGASDELKPLTAVENDNGSSGLFFAGGLPSTTGGKS